MSPHAVLAVDWEGGVSDAWSEIVNFLPKLVIFAIILLVGWLIAKALAKAVDMALERTGFDRAVERGGVKKALSGSRYDASDIVAKLVKYAILLLTLVMAFNVFGPNPVSNLLSDVVAWLPNLAVAIIILVVAAAIARAVKDLVGGALGGLSYGNAIATFAFVAILFLGIVAALNQIGVATAVTTPVLVAILATIGGVIVVGVGGGLVRPMQARWESWLTRAELESGRMRTHLQARREGMHESAGLVSGGPAEFDRRYGSTDDIGGTSTSTDQDITLSHPTSSEFRR